MRGRTLLAFAVCLNVVGGIWATLDAQRAGSFMGSSDDPAIRYSTAPLNNAVVDVNRKLQEGSLQLTFEGRSGFLRSALEALQIPVDSQLLVFSRASLQGRLINEQNPRALFFNDRVALGWVRDGEFIEVAAHDESAGVVFYTLEQRAGATYRRAAVQAGLPVPGVSRGGRYARRARPADVQHDTPDPSQGFGLPRRIDHSDALRDALAAGSSPAVLVRRRTWGMTWPRSTDVPARELASAEGLFDADGYRALSSDIVAHLVFTPPDGHDEPPDARQLGSARRGSVAAPAIHVQS